MKVDVTGPENESRCYRDRKMKVDVTGLENESRRYRTGK